MLIGSGKKFVYSERKEGNQKDDSHYDCLHLQPARGGAALTLILRKRTRAFFF